MGCTSSQTKTSNEINPNQNANKTTQSTLNKLPTDTPKEVTWKTVHSAVRWNKLDEVKQLVQTYPELIDSKDDKNGNTAMHVAAQNGHYDLVKVSYAYYSHFI